MNLKYNYWYFTSELSKQVCNKIIKAGKNKKSELGIVGNIKEKNKKRIKEIKNKRNSNVSWLNDQWIYETITPYVLGANESAGWNFETSWSEACQFTKYSKGQFYDWHQDSWEEPYKSDNINFNGKIRKLSVTVSLSDSKEYEGGELQFKIFNTKTNDFDLITCKEILPQGSIVVFPSHILHRVTPVTKGTRYSLVIWTLGNPFV
jgi:predicted 2-oxoglutarate/Fe(II)-dependent dioxygenase YbiX